MSNSVALRGPTAFPPQVLLLRRRFSVYGAASLAAGTRTVTPLGLPDSISCCLAM